MQVHRRGSIRDCGPKPLINEELSTENTECSEEGVIAKIYGQKHGNSTYDYEIKLSWNDIRNILHEALPE